MNKQYNTSLLNLILVNGVGIIKEIQGRRCSMVCLSVRRIAGPQLGQLRVKIRDTVADNDIPTLCCGATLHALDKVRERREGGEI